MTPSPLHSVVEAMGLPTSAVEEVALRPSRDPVTVPAGPAPAACSATSRAQPPSVVEAMGLPTSAVEEVALPTSVVEEVALRPSRDPVTVPAGPTPAACSATSRAQPWAGRLVEAR